MINRIDIKHFKCFETLKLPLAALTVLSGGNASGKSTVIQALALLHQTMHEDEWSSHLKLNGSSIHLGTVAEIVDQVTGRLSYSTALIEQNSDRLHWEFSGDRTEMFMSVKRSSGEIDGIPPWDNDSPGLLQHLIPRKENQHIRKKQGNIIDRLCRLTYLSAERLGPREHYQLDPKLTHIVGPKGEFAASVLYSFGEDTIQSNLLPDTPPTLFRQVEARMNKFFPGCLFKIDPIQRTNNLTLGVRLSQDTDFHRPLNTGFGLTQVFPIVVAALSVKQEDILLIENPEVHLHPAAQGEMGAFLAQVASNGVQIVIETHSDHILNGIRRAVKSGKLSREDLALHFFRPRTEVDVTQTQVESPTIDDHGNLDSWPDGFFDQFDKDINDLAGWS